jgi:hypothetical protein
MLRVRPERSWGSGERTIPPLRRPIPGSECVGAPGSTSIVASGSPSAHGNTSSRHQVVEFWRAFAGFFRVSPSICSGVQRFDVFWLEFFP